MTLVNSKVVKPWGELYGTLLVELVRRSFYPSQVVERLGFGYWVEPEAIEWIAYAIATQLVGGSARDYIPASDWVAFSEAEFLEALPLEEDPTQA